MKESEIRVGRIDGNGRLDTVPWPIIGKQKDDRDTAWLGVF